MDGVLLHVNNRERILGELKSNIKQVYHEAVNHELRQENVNYITQNLLKWLDESLLYGIKNPQHGYWKIVQRILHPDSLTQISRLPGIGSSGRCKGRSWLAISLLDDALVSYMDCFVKESGITKQYEEWSIIRNSDCCNMLLSLLTGLQNVSFQFELVDGSKTIQKCSLSPRLISQPPFWSPTPSLSDSGVQLDRSEDYLNGNMTTPVVLRRKVKDTQRHVSFHEDSYSKSPSGRRLKWDCENLRYSWAGEELDPFKLPELNAVRTPHELPERGVPEGQETPRDANFHEIKKTVEANPKGYFKYRKNSRKTKIDWNNVAKVNRDLEIEINSYRKPRPLYEIQLPVKLGDMLGLNRHVRTWSYKLLGKLLIITGDRIIILHRDLHTTILNLAQLEQIVVQPHMHSFYLLTKKRNHVLTSGEEALSSEILTRLAFNMHRADLPPIDFRILQPEDVFDVKRELVSRRVLNEQSPMLYIGTVRLQPDESPTLSETIDKRGGIMYQVGTSQQWLPGNLLLRGGVLHLHTESKTPVTAINLLTSCESCERTQNSERPHTFRITLKHSLSFENMCNCFYEDIALKTENAANQKSALERWTNSVLPSDTISQWMGKVGGLLRNEPSTSTSSTSLHFAAADEYEMSDWLQAILMGFCSLDEPWDSEASECSLLITEESMILFLQPAPPQQGFRVLASALINEICSFNVGCHQQDSYAVIELECMEAGSNTSDWIVHFGSRAELEKAMNLLKMQWQQKHPFPICVISDPRCERTQACLTREWFS